MCVFVCVLLPSSAHHSNSSAAKCENLLMYILFHYYFYFLHSLCGDIVQSLQIGCPPFYTGCVSTKVEDRRQRTVSLRCVCRRKMLKKHFRPEPTVMWRRYTLYILTTIVFWVEAAAHTDLCTHAYVHARRQHSELPSCRGVLWVGRDGARFHAASWGASYLNAFITHTDPGTRRHTHTHKHAHINFACQLIVIPCAWGWGIVAGRQ